MDGVQEIVTRVVEQPFRLPPAFDYLATFLWAITGGLIAARRGYDIAGISVVGVILIGTINAVGGGVLRDVLLRKEVTIFRPGTLLGLAVVLGCILYLALTAALAVPDNLAAWVTIAFVFSLRLLSVRLGWRTVSARGFTAEPQDEPLQSRR